MLRKDLSSDKLEKLRQALEAFKSVSRVARASKGEQFFEDIMAAFKKAEKEPKEEPERNQADLIDDLVGESKQLNRFKKLAGIIKG